MYNHIGLTINTGYEEVEVIHIGEVSKKAEDLFERALGFPLGNLDGWLCEEKSHVLEEAVRTVNENPKDFEFLAYEDNLGYYESFSDYLTRLRDKSLNHPLCIFRIN